MPSGEVMLLAAIAWVKGGRQIFYFLKEKKFNKSFLKIFF